MSDETVRLRLPEPVYTLFNAVRQGLPDVVVVNEALLAFKDIEIFPWHLTIIIEARDMAENGMPTRAESDVLLDLAEKIEATLLEAATDQGSDNVLFLARSTWNRRCELDYYVHDPEIAHQALQVLINDPSNPREWQYHMEADPQWEGARPFFELFSSAKGHDG